MPPQVLLVEDDQFKKVRISELLASELDLNKIHFAGSVMSAIDYIDNHQISLVVLDLAIPDYEEAADGAQGLGGVTVFRYLRQIMRHVPVVVITQFEALKFGDRLIDVATISNQLAEEFGPQFLGLVQYQPSTDKWKSNLVQIIKKAVKS